MTSRVLRLGRRRVLVVTPKGRRQWQHYGHVGLELAMALTEARERQADLYVLPPRRVAHETLLEVESDQVRIVRSFPLAGIVRAWLALDAWIRAAADWWCDGMGRVSKETRSVIGEHLARHPHAPGEARLELKRASERLRVVSRSPALRKARLRPYYQRRLLSEPVPTRLRAEAEHRAEETARSLGIGPESRLVTVHAREPGYKREVEFRKEKPWLNAPQARNAWIATYFPAIDFLVEQGYTVVRIGDPTMTPVSRPGVIDMATSPLGNPLVQLHCLFRSRFLLCGESGPLSVTYLTNTPLLTVNATDPVSAFPVRADGLYVLKTVVERSTGRRLGGEDLLSEEYLKSLRDLPLYQYLSNTPEEILAAVHEMIDLLDHGTPETPSQARFRELVTEASERHRVAIAYVRKWGADDGFIGHGRVARLLAERWFPDGDRAVKAVPA